MTDGTAIISPCGRYRYVITRRVPQTLRWVKPMLFVCLNPSVADATVPDPTLTRCVGYADREKCTEVTIVNLFAFRATYPKDMRAAADPFGPDNRRHVEEQWIKHVSIGVIVVAWGAQPFALRSDLRKEMSGKGALCLGTTKAGEPRHPLMVRADQPLVPWSMPA